MPSDHPGTLAGSTDTRDSVVTRVACLAAWGEGGNRVHDMPLSPGASSPNLSALQTKRVHAGGGGGGGERDEASSPGPPAPSHHGTVARREGWEEDAAELLLSAAATAGVCVCACE